ncbi:MAG: response regulator [Cyanophyceae cyanobacterium]
MSPPPVLRELQIQLSQIAEKKFTGKLLIESKALITGSITPQWSLYFCLGRVFWASDNLNRNRRVLHHLAQSCPQLKQRKFALRQGDNFDCVNYTLIFVLLQRKVLNKESFAIVIERVLQDILFDVIHHQHTKGDVHWTYEPYDPLDILKIAATPISSDLPLTNAAVEWANWRKIGLGPISPNHALVVKESSQLQATLGESTYQKLAIALDGRSNIRGIAKRMGKSPGELMQSLLPYIKRKLIGVRYLKDSADLVILSQGPGRGDRDVDRPPPIKESPDKERRRSKTVDSHGIVACIDDSPQICDTMTRIVQEAGYEIFCIQDSTRALTQLLERKPQLIFLDLIMPVANGYEICSQIRRIATFRDIPIVILTGSDGIIDRVRAKVVGANDFLGKPVEQNKINAVLERYLGAKNVHPSLAPQPYPGNA